jgi:GxxExxY protein
MSNGKIISKDISYKIMGALYNVHNALGPGFSENIYEKALIEEFNRQSIPFVNQPLIKIKYNDKVVGLHKLDFIIANEVVLEIKAQPDLLPIHHMQVRSYLKSVKIKLGILANFGKEKVEAKRILV